MDFIEMVKAAIELEIEGYGFYMECLRKTNSETGKDMFEFLAKEEIVHREKLEQEYKRHTDSDYTSTSAGQSRIFPEDVEGGKADEKADELDALNMSIEAEKRSIAHYMKMLDETNEQATIGLIKDIIKDEEKHLAILEKEVEFVTQTGEYTDFRAVSF